jgi:hypothetical protein
MAMRIPGFTAESSLNRAGESYRLTRIQAKEQGIIPQGCFPSEGGVTCCVCDPAIGCFCHLKSFRAPIG